MKLMCDKCKNLEEYVEISKEDIQFECGFIRRMTIEDLNKLFRKYGGQS